ncbi:MAG: hypothetical protein DRN12_07180 [Thermoplasmata archaeon]|nr:MAG: hypothetical protein DRN12_07180 [Thermoplasmata archaeon]
MKEGYLQKKLVELNEKCRTLDQMISFEKANIERLQEQVGGFKQLLKRLKNVEEFKEQVMREIIDENRKHIDSISEKIIREMNKNIDKTLEHRSKDLKNAIQQLKKYEEEMRLNLERLEEISKTVDYLFEYNRLFMLKLMNKGIISNREITEIDRRAKKRK